MREALIDTHCHITCDRLYPRIDEIIEHAKTHHIQRMLIVCVNFEEYERAVLCVAKEPALFDIALGFHPNDLYAFSEDDYTRLEGLLKDHKLIALGEIGLDYHWDDVKKEDQMIGFKRQLDMAATYHMPVLIHMRDATQDTLQILSEYPNVTGVFHCFSGSKESADIALKMGYYISIGGPVTFKNARGLPETVAQIPADRLFVETDCPFLTPHPFRGKENEPMYVRYTFEKVCTCKNMAHDEMALQMQKNYQALFMR